MKRLLIVVDYQNDFVSGSLGFEKAIQLEKSIVETIKEYQNNNDEVIYTMDTHPQNYLETYEGCLCFKKETFPSLDLANYLKDK